MTENSAPSPRELNVEQVSLRRPRTISPAEAVIHLMKGNLGPGVLALPLQFVRVGAPIGLAVLAIVGMQGVYCMWLIVATQHAVHKQGRAAELPDRRNSPAEPLSFEDLGQLAFGRSGRRLVQSSVLCLQLGICCVFLSLVGENLVHSMELPRWQAVTCAYVPCLLLSLLPDLSHLSALSAFGTAAMLFALGSASVAAVLQLLNGGVDAHAPAAGWAPLPPASAPSLPPPPPLLPPPHAPHEHTFPGFAAIGGAAASCFYALEGVSMMIPVGNAMAPDQVHRYPCLLKGALTAVVCIFAMVAAATALAFPDISSASITADMAARFGGTPFSALFETANLVVSAAVVATFPLQLTPVRLIIESSFHLESIGARLVSRVITVSGCFAVVLAITNLAILIDIVGAVANTVLAALPCAIHAQLLLSRGASAQLLKRDGYTRTLEDVDGDSAHTLVPPPVVTQELPPTGDEPPTQTGSRTANGIVPVGGSAAGLSRAERASIGVDAIMIAFCVVVAGLGVWSALNHMMEVLRHR